MGGGPPTHHHNSYDEAFYVLSGEMEVRVDGETARVPARSMAWVARGVTHGLRNPWPELARMPVVTTPDAIVPIIRLPEGLRSAGGCRRYSQCCCSQREWFSGTPNGCLAPCA